MTCKDHSGYWKSAINDVQYLYLYCCASY